MNEPKHPAKYSKEILEAAGPWLAGYAWVLDPFAGVGRIHDLPMKTVGIEIEPEWAEAREGTIVGDALDLPYGVGAVPAIFTSPTYGNRFADRHNAQDGSTRRSYTHDLRSVAKDPDRDLHPHNSGAMQWGVDYRDFHQAAYCGFYSALAHDGRLVLNMKNHIRNGTIQRVAEWHLGSLLSVGFELTAIEVVNAPGLRHGANRERVDHEYLFVVDVVAPHA